MANMAPTVNRDVEMLVAFANRHYVLTAEKPEIEGCPISLPELRSLYEKLGPQNTNELGHKIARVGSRGRARNRLEFWSSALNTQSNGTKIRARNENFCETNSTSAFARSSKTGTSKLSRRRQATIQKFGSV
jgi:hypothetical protein